jgi:hypothetical protein
MGINKNTIDSIVIAKGDHLGRIHMEEMEGMATQGYRDDGDETQSVDYYGAILCYIDDAENNERHYISKSDKKNLISYMQELKGRLESYIEDAEDLETFEDL